MGFKWSDFVLFVPSLILNAFNLYRFDVRLMYSRNNVAVRFLLSKVEVDEIISPMSLYRLIFADIW